MTDQELIRFLGIESEPKAQAIVEAMSPNLRDAYENMAAKMHEIDARLDERRRELRARGERA